MTTMDIGQFVDIVQRNNATCLGMRFIVRDGRSQAGAPADTCTLLVGAWLPVHKSDDDPMGTVHRDHVGTWNVPIPSIPEYTVANHEGRIVARGWKGLFQLLLQDRVIRPSREIVKLLGDDWETVRRSANIRCY